jgi:hypothetical protein
MPFAFRKDLSNLNVRRIVIFQPVFLVSQPISAKRWNSAIHQHPKNEAPDFLSFA